MTPKGVFSDTRRVVPNPLKGASNENDIKAGARRIWFQRSPRSYSLDDFGGMSFFRSYKAPSNLLSMCLVHSGISSLFLWHGLSQIAMH
jgi:hypothetical protein